MNIFLDDRKFTGNLFPFMLTRHIADIPLGIFTIREKWQQLTGATIYTDYTNLPADCIAMAAQIIPTAQNIELLLKASDDKTPVMDNDSIRSLQYPWQIVQWNDWAMRQDFDLISKNRISANLLSSVRTTNPDDIFVEPTADVRHCIINAATGPVYIGPNAVIMEGSLIRGPFSIGRNSVLKMGSKIYGATSIGDNCMAGGEIKNSLIFSNSNKAHDGYMGDSVIGSWCNWGAGTSNSNVKNTGGNVYYCLDPNSDPIAAGNKAGLLMGDYSQTAVNTVFNTGAVVGVCCNIFGDVSAKKYFENFSWGDDRYIFEKALTNIENWKKMKNNTISTKEVEMLRSLYENT